MENVPFIDDFPIKTPIYEGFSMAMLVITRWYIYIYIYIYIRIYVRMTTDFFRWDGFSNVKQIGLKRLAMGKWDGSR